MNRIEENKCKHIHSIDGKWIMWIYFSSLQRLMCWIIKKINYMIQETGLVYHH
ncbi:hypothetical protein [Caldiplasma sukawensis]